MLEKTGPQPILILEEQEVNEKELKLIEEQQKKFEKSKKENEESCQ